LGSATAEKSGLASLGKRCAASTASGLIRNPAFWLEGEAKREPSGQLQKPNRVSQHGNSQAEM